MSNKFDLIGFSVAIQQWRDKINYYFLLIGNARAIMAQSLLFLNTMSDVDYPNIEHLRQNIKAFLHTTDGMSSDKTKE